MLVRKTSIDLPSERRRVRPKWAFSLRTDASHRVAEKWSESRSFAGKDLHPGPAPPFRVRPERVGRHDRRIDDVGRHGEGLAVDGFLRPGGDLGDAADLFLRRIGHADVRERHGKTDIDAEPEDFVDERRGAVLQHELDDDAEGDLLAVIEAVRLPERRDAVMERVRGRQAAALEADARQKRVRLDDALDRFGRDAAFDRELRLTAVFEDRVVAQPARSSSAAFAATPPER